MSDGMHRVVLTVKAQLNEGLLYEVLDITYTDGLACTLAIEQIFFWLIDEVVGPQFQQHLLGENRVAVFGTLALHNFDAHVGAVNIGNPQIGYFTYPHATAVEQHDDSPVLEICYRIDKCLDLLWRHDRRQGGGDAWIYH